MFTTKKRSDVVLSMSNHGCIRTVITIRFRDILTNSKTMRLDRKDHTHLCYFLFAVIFNTSHNNLPFSRLHTQKP